MRDVQSPKSGQHPLKIFSILSLAMVWRNNINADINNLGKLTAGMAEAEREITALAPMIQTGKIKIAFGRTKERSRIVDDEQGMRTFILTADRPSTKETLAKDLIHLMGIHNRLVQN
ncbi:MAG: hypothetical protein AB7H77_06835 [Bdellovibrionales bacterium]